jgi:hypothetical protein
LSQAHQKPRYFVLGTPIAQEPVPEETMARYEMVAEQILAGMGPGDAGTGAGGRILADRPGEGRTKGMNLLHMRSWVIERHGQDGWQRVRASLGPADAAVVASLVPVGWYDLRLQHRLLRTIDAVLGDGDLRLVPSIGRHAAMQDLTRIHKLFLRLATPAFVLQKASDYWSRFYDTGRWEVEPHGERGARGVLRDFAVPDRAFCLYLFSYIERTFRLTGVQGGNLAHSSCVCRGDHACVFAGSWTL